MNKDFNINKVRAALLKFKEEVRRKGLKVLQIEVQKSKDLNFAQGGRPAKWNDKVFKDGRAILTGKTGALQARTTAKIDYQNNRIVLGSNLRYNRIHNEGGKIIKTAKMIKFFWAMYYANSTKTTGKNGKPKYLPSPAGAIWRNMALSDKPIVIKKRQYLIIPPADFPRILNQFTRVVKSIKI